MEKGKAAILVHMLVKLTTPCCFKLTTLRELS